MKAEALAASVTGSLSLKRPVVCLTSSVDDSKCQFIQDLSEFVPRIVGEILGLLARWLGFDQDILGSDLNTSAPQVLDKVTCC